MSCCGSCGGQTKEVESKKQDDEKTSQTSTTEQDKAKEKTES